MPRWTVQEQQCLDIMKERLKDQLAASPQYPEVVGERKMIRFLRGHGHDVDKVTTMMSNFLKWRQENKINEIRTNIVERGCDHPLKFPKGEIILSLIPQLVILPNAMDNTGSPICVEQYNFVPSEVFKHINIDDYILFVTYSLEYRSLIVEQLSEQRERAMLAGLSQDQLAKLQEPDSSPYGVIVNTCVIRDLVGVGFTHLSAQGQDIIKAVITVASDNYPELMRKCFMINTPFIFNAVWFVIKGLLAARTIAKVSVRGSGYMDELLQEIKMENLPAMVGGGYTGFVTYEPYAFEPAYFLPSGSSFTAAAGDSASIATAAADSTDCSHTIGANTHVAVEALFDDEVSCVAAPSDVSSTVTEVTEISSSGAGSTRSGELSPLSPASDDTVVSSVPESVSPTTGVRARNAPAAAPSASNAAVSTNKAEPSNKSVTLPARAKDTEPEDMDFSIISMRTSGY